MKDIRGGCVALAIAGMGRRDVVVVQKICECIFFTING